MRTFFSVLILLLAGCSTNNNSTALTGQTQVDSFNIEELIEGYSNCTTHATMENQQEYFRVFPSEVVDFNESFGLSVLDDTLVESELYNDSFDYVNLLFELNSIEPERFVDKLVSLVCELEWEADAVNHLQYRLINYSISNPNSIAAYLSEAESDEVVGFWRFYFEGPVALKSIPEEFIFLEESDMQVYKVMHEEWEKALKRAE